MPVLLQSDRLLWRLACDQGAYKWSLQRQNITSCSTDSEFKTDFRWGSHMICLCLCASPPEQCWGCPGELTAGRSRADGCWCLPETRCRDAAGSATCWPPGEIQRSSDRLLQTADVLTLCLMEQKKQMKQHSKKKKKGTYEIRQAENIPIHTVEPTFLLLAYILPTVTVSH